MIHLKNQFIRVICSQQSWQAQTHKTGLCAACEDNLIKKHAVLSLLCGTQSFYHITFDSGRKWQVISMICPLRPKEKTAVRLKRKPSEREVEFIRKICMKRRFNNFSTNLEAWSTQRQMGERRRGGRGQSDDREVLDGVISETRAVRRAVILTISHKAVLLISMEELRWNWIHLAISLSLSLSLWGGKAMIHVIIIYYGRIPSQAKHLILQYSTAPYTHTYTHTHTLQETQTHFECHSLE